MKVCNVCIEFVDLLFIDCFRNFLRLEMVVGWYYFYFGFGCWLLGVDINI